jgi:hypothetical protein
MITDALESGKSQLCPISGTTFVGPILGVDVWSVNGGLDCIKQRHDIRYGVIARGNQDSIVHLSEFGSEMWSVKINYYKFVNRKIMDI